MRTAFGSACKGAFAALLLALLPIASRGADAGITSVSTAEELQAALKSEVTHIRILDHLNATGLEPQVTYLLHFDVNFPFEVLPGTKSITGACDNEPDAVPALEGPWKVGMCLIDTAGSSGFLIGDHTGMLWLDSLYLRTRGEVQPVNTYGIFESFEGGGSAAMYWTHLTIEMHPAAANASWLHAREHIPVDIINNRVDRFEMLLADVHVVYNDSLVDWGTADEVLPLINAFSGEAQGNCTFNLIDTTVVNLHARRLELLDFDCDLRLENVALMSEPKAEYDLSYYDVGATSVSWYSDDTELRITTWTGDPGPDLQPLAQSTREQRLADDSLPFLTLDDPAFLALESEVFRGVESLNSIAG